MLKPVASGRLCKLARSNGAAIAFGTNNVESLANMKGLARSLCPPLIWNFARRHFGSGRYSLPPSQIACDDDFTAWMSFIVPGMLDRGNIELFSHCFAHLPSNAPIIEIGSFAGRSLNYIIHLLRKTGRTNEVFSVDHWGFEGARPGDKIGGIVPFDAYREQVIETFRRNAMLFSGDRLPHHIELNSNAFFDAWQAKQTRVDFFGTTVQLGGPIAFAYIDGEHTYSQSKKDFENVDRFLEPGGFIVFDDSADGSKWESNRTAREATDLPRYELLAKNPNYCLRKRPAMCSH